MKTLASLFVASCLLSPSVSADIYKCTDAKGNDKYQNFPCPIDSIGSKATAPPPKEETAKPNPAQTASTATEPNHAPPSIGMKMNQIRAEWGVPKKTKVVKGIEIWYYDGPAGTRGIHFDRTGTVLAVNEAEPPPEPDADDE